MLKDYCKILPHYLAPKQALTRLGGWVAERQAPWLKNYIIQRFITKYQVNMQDAFEENPLNYASFNDFFIRRLKAERRPLAQADIVSPVDGVISEMGEIKQGQILQAKGHYYTASNLLACDEALSAQFLNGHFATLYLAPKDYHRIHMPVTGQLQSMIYVPGRLISVQSLTARMVPQLFARNERLVVFFKTEKGIMAMVLVGATIVGSISTVWQTTIPRSKNLQIFDFKKEALVLEQGAEMGHFKLGSTVVLLFDNHHEMAWMNTLHRGEAIQYGQSLGAFVDREKI